jgi:hypothetical protein
MTFRLTSKSLVFMGTRSSRMMAPSVHSSLVLKTNGLDTALMARPCFRPGTGLTF